MLQLTYKRKEGEKEKMVDYLKRLFDRLDAKYETLEMILKQNIFFRKML